MKIILASGSGVRKKILDKYKIESDVIVSNVDEDQVKEALLSENATPLVISKNLAEIKSIKVRSSKNRIEIEFRSKSFLQQQVRSMVGCLKYLGEKKWDLKTFEKAFKSKKRLLCAPPAPPEGLFLLKIIY